MGGSVSSANATVKAEAQFGSSVPPQGCPMHQARQESKSIAKLRYSLINLNHLFHVYHALNSSFSSI